MGFKARAAGGARSIAVRPGLQLGMFEVGDSRELFAVVERNRPYLREWMPWLDISKTEEELRSFVQSSVDGYASGLCCRWALLVEEKIAGVISLEDVSVMHGRAKIGYWQAKKHQGRGFITDAVRSVLRYGFEERNLNLIEIRAAVENRKSRAVAERVGMKLDGVLRQREWLYDHYVDLASYTLLSKEWRESILQED
ncbi:MAG: GNAT family N-acetyltransferase [Myxococcales bacterium]|nr:GNAT family N-acetyltransferase [Myxococcales bacterium]